MKPEYQLCINPKCRKRMPVEADYCPGCFGDLKPVYKGKLPDRSNVPKSCFDCMYGVPIESEKDKACCKLNGETGFHEDTCDKHEILT